MRHPRRPNAERPSLDDIREELPTSGLTTIPVLIWGLLTVQQFHHYGILFIASAPRCSIRKALTLLFLGLAFTFAKIPVCMASHQPSTIKIKEHGRSAFYRCPNSTLVPRFPSSSFTVTRMHSSHLHIHISGGSASRGSAAFTLAIWTQYQPRPGSLLGQPRSPRFADCFHDEGSLGARQTIESWAIVYSKASRADHEGRNEARKLALLLYPVVWARRSHSQRRCPC